MGKSTDTLSIEVFKDVVYYDGYAAPVNISVADGLIRTNTSYMRKLSSQEKKELTHGNIKLSVNLKAACDNYDRLASVSLVFTPKGSQPDQRSGAIEIARYITPFMDKNKTPSVRPYTWDGAEVNAAFKSALAMGNTDIFIKMDVFGVPYAAQKQVKGCEGRNDVFIGNLTLQIVKASGKYQKLKLLPVAYQDSINNYKGTDTLGTTTRKYQFSVDQSLKQATIHLITSNHGANRNGEEYSRRLHLVYLDDKLIFSYTPGETSCEPYRQYNTQSNGIYGKTVKTEEQWQRFSNWCPGAKIPIREINLDKLSKGKHQLMIRVPDAKFENKEGVIPVSMYITYK